MATNYPTAYYINLLDGVPGSVRLATNTALGTDYAPPGMGNYGIFTTNFATARGILEAVKAAPAPATASWQASATSVLLDANQHLAQINFNGLLPVMAVGVEPCGWKFIERGWQITIGSTGDRIPYSFMDVNDTADGNGILRNTFPVYFVPYFRVSSSSISSPYAQLSGARVNNVTITIAPDKPLNPKQVDAVFTKTITSVAGSGRLALPAVVLNGCTLTTHLNAHGQVDQFLLLVPFSLAGDNVIPPNSVYNVQAKVTQPLTYLKATQIVTETITVMDMPVVAQVAGVTAGPTFTGYLSVGPEAAGSFYYSAHRGLTVYTGNIQISYSATHPQGVSTAVRFWAEVAPQLITLKTAVATGDPAPPAYKAIFNFFGEGYVRTHPTNDPDLTSYSRSPVSGTFTIKSEVGDISTSTNIPSFLVANLDTVNYYYGTDRLSAPISRTLLNGYPTYANVGFVYMRIPIPSIFLKSVRMRAVQSSNGVVLADKTLRWKPGNQLPFGTTQFALDNANLVTDVAVPGWVFANKFDDVSTDIGAYVANDDARVSAFHPPLGNTSSVIMTALVTDINNSVRTYTATFYTSSVYTWIDDGGGGCVPYAAQILMADGSTQDAGLVTEGSLLMTRNAITGELEACAVAEVLPKGVQPCVKLTYTDGTSRECSTTHRVFVDTDTSYYEAKDLQVGMVLLAADGPRTIASIEPATKQPVLTFSMAVETNRNYFADDMLAHNDKIYDCVVAGTPVSMADGTTKAIESLIPGESVLSFDEATMVFRPGRVYARFATTATRLFTVAMANGATVTCSPTHMFKTQDAWIRAEALFLTDSDERPALLVEDGSMQAVERITVTDHPEGVKVYLVEIEHDHNLVAGGIACHNDVKDPYA